MKTIIIIGSVFLLLGLTLGGISFVESTIEYADFQTAKSVSHKVQVKGVLVQETEAAFDASTGEFTFFLRDEQGAECRVVYKGAKPNHFDLADALVVKGRYENGNFRASEILTKCPSKYEADVSSSMETQQ